MPHEQYRRLMEEMLDNKLYRHSLGVAEAAASLAERYQADVQKAYFSGIVHDYGKRYSSNELIARADRLKITLDRITRQESRLLHAPVGAALLRAELNINDPEILRAVAYHTTGRNRMSGLEKVVYLADYIEKGRKFPGVENIRQIARKDIDRALLAAVEFAIGSVMERGLMLHPRSVAFRNYLLASLRSRKRKSCL